MVITCAPTNSNLFSFPITCCFQCSGSSPFHSLREWWEIDLDYGTPAYKTSTVGPFTQDFGGEEEYYIWDRNGGIFESVLENLDEDHLRLNKVWGGGGGV